jgi:Cu+-exporting ATPase
MYRDPVCGMTVDPDETEWFCTYLGETYYFCSEACLNRFEQNPTRYVQDSVGGTGGDAEPEYADDQR